MKCVKEKDFFRREHFPGKFNFYSEIESEYCARSSYDISHARVNLNNTCYVTEDDEFNHKNSLII